MDKNDRQHIFNQFYLFNLQDLNLTKTSSYSKAEAYLSGCLRRQNLQLYQSQKYFLTDIQTILNYDPESAEVILSDNKIKFNKESKRVLTQCRHCGKMTEVYEFCQKCEEIHYCSETCKVNAKITHEKEECRIKLYPKLQHGTTVEVHFGSDLGQNIQIYFQHETRMSSLIRGEEIIKELYEYFTSGEGSFKVPENFQLHLKDNHAAFTVEKEKNFKTGGQSIQIESFEDLRRIYEDSQVLELIEIYLLKQGGLMTNYAKQVHNNHIHLVYIFCIP